MGQINYKKSQSFVLRDGWIQKALIEMQKTPDENVFSKRDGVIRLGIGTNMVSSLKYWLDSAGITKQDKKKNAKLSELGRLIVKNDRYLESMLPWHIIHLNLIENKCEAPLFYYLFNEMGPNEAFTKDSFCEDYIRNFDAKANPQYVSDDFSVLIRTYLSSERLDPEDNMDSPLSRLKLLKSTGKGQYRKTAIPTEAIIPSVIYYQILNLAGKGDSVAFEDLVASRSGPCKAFNLDRSTLMSVIASLANQGFLSIAKTAGLNTIYLPQNRSTDLLKDLFQNEYGDAK